MVIPCTKGGVNDAVGVTICPGTGKFNTVAIGTVWAKPIVGVIEVDVNAMNSLGQAWISSLYLGKNEVTTIEG